MALRRLICVVMVLVLALGAAGCRKELSTPLVEQMVEGYYYGAVRIEVDATCPENVEMLPNNHFVCRFTYGTDGSKDGTVIVLQHDRYGRITFYRSDPVDHEKVEREVAAWLQREHDLKRDVTCPDDVVPLAGFNFECQAGDRTVRVRQVNGNLTFMYTLAGEETTGGTS